ncbi:MAG: Na(+)-translocating NADH-quinone reductase subunit A [Marinilabiliaceae bacterium]|nr:Na(+)-translocating NADH-quinone reductase subunit A [Marinilabiliaceae bacterium]
MSEVIKLKRGLDIRLAGRSETVYANVAPAEQYAIKPSDFKGLTPKMVAKVGDKVNAGDALFVDKMHPEVRFVSPVSGELIAVNRGERRVILEVVVKADGNTTTCDFGKEDIQSLSRDQIITKLLNSGAWTYFKQRPYNIVADPQLDFKSIFVSTFDTAPLAPDYDFVINGNEANFQAGLDVLSKIAPTFIGVQAESANKAFNGAKGVTITKFSGKHPSGCVGIQINNVQPINIGERVLTIGVQEVVAIGKMFTTGILDFGRIVVVCGSEIKKPAYIRTIVGAQLTNILKDNIASDNVRVISGDVLTGTQTATDGYLGYYDDQVSVIPEGNDYEFMGWAMPGFNKFSNHKTFLSWLTGNKSYKLDTNMHGERRAFVVSGELDEVLPMDIYPEFLFKAIMAQDIDKMIELGICEVVEEDIALCEFVCTSKIPLQKILRNGLNLMAVEVG